MKKYSGSYKDLVVWQKSMDLVVEIYKLTSEFPPTEQYGLIQQMRRCAVSIPSNIAEGRRRESDKQYLRFLHIAYGSGAELETQLDIARRVKFLDQEKTMADSLLLEVMKILNTLTH